MSVRHQIHECDGMYCITFTCHNWLPLFEIINGYHLVYEQFNYLKSCGHSIAGYVIMHNHVHALIHFADTGKKVNTIVGNMKRFLTYSLVKELDRQHKTDILQLLVQGVNKTDRSRGKLHEVFEPSFDCKYCYGDNFGKEYIHNNPVKNKWQLAKSAVEYPHSSAYFYTEGKQGVYEVTSYKWIGE